MRGFFGWSGKRLALGLFLVLFSDPAMAITDQVRAAVDREIFQVVPGGGKRVFKNRIPMRVGVFYEDGLNPVMLANAINTLNKVGGIFAKILHRGMFRSAIPNKVEPGSFFLFHFIDDKCDQACKEQILDRRDAKFSFSNYFFIGARRVCESRVPVDVDKGIIVGGVAYIEIGIPQSMLLHCLLQLTNGMIASTDALKAAQFMRSNDVKNLPLEDILKKGIAWPERLIALQYLYHPAIEPGMSHEAFWSTMERFTKKKATK